MSKKIDFFGQNILAARNVKIYLKMPIYAHFNHIPQQMDALKFLKP